MSNLIIVPSQVEKIAGEICCFRKKKDSLQAVTSFISPPCSFLQLTNKTISNSQTELENRLHQLTETLIQKQTMLEALGTEKSSLVFQLERLEQQLKNAQGGQSGGQAINMGGLEVPG